MSLIRIRFQHSRSMSQSGVRSSLCYNFIPAGADCIKLHNIYVPELKVKVTIWGQRSKYASVTAQKITEAKFNKIHKKIKHHERIICHAQHIGSDTQGQGHNQRSKASHFFLSYQKNYCSKCN